MRRRISDPEIVYRMLKANGIKVKERSEIPKLNSGTTKTNIILVQTPRFEKIGAVKLRSSDMALSELERVRNVQLKLSMNGLNSRRGTYKLKGVPLKIIKKT